MKPRKSLANAVEAYYQTLKGFEHQRAFHEGAVSVAFQTLLADAARPHHWTLVPQLSDKKTTGSIRPDGTLKDPMNLVRGHWEAKDTSDNLDDEITRKIKKGYPLANIIFEDTRRAVLFQNKTEVMRVDLKDPEQIARLLDQFFAYVEPQIEGFEQAINEFKERVPELARHLKEKVTDAHAGNKPFKQAFARFFELCKTSLNPNIAKEAVDDMLVQHLLTERLIREVFDNPEFTRRNVIAAEIEKVIEALTSKAFNRNVFLKSLDRFYIAIENAARTITDWSDKQHFLNTVYERFFQGYSVKLADTMGIVYTPQPIVDFMCASVAEVLEKEFGKTLGSPDVHILDPCTGTGNFIVNLMKRIPKRDLPRVYKQQLFANEIMLLPYYIAAMNIEHAYYELTGDYEPFEGMCFVDTLDMAETQQAEMSFMTAKNTERVERQKRTPITVIIGNPPYNASQKSENENNKNRKYPVVDGRIKATYIKLNSAQKTKLYEPYVRFFRWACDRLENRPGIVCFVTNNSFVHQSACDGLQRALGQDFDLVYHLDMRGNVRENPTLSGTAYNVFGIQLGVGITVAVRTGTKRTHRIFFHALPLELRGSEKLQRLATSVAASGMQWESSVPQPDGLWRQATHADLFAEYIAIGTKAAKISDNEAPAGVLFGTYSLGASTNRDDVVYDFSAASLHSKVNAFVNAYNAEVDRFDRRSNRGAAPDQFVDTAKLKWSRNLKRHLGRGTDLKFAETFVRRSLYRPFTQMRLYRAPIATDELGLWQRFLPTEATESENVWLGAPTVGNRSKSWMPFVGCNTPNLNLTSIDAYQCFPFYLYDEDGSNRRENITDWALEQFRSHYKDKKIGKWDIFHYVYGLLHHPGYRTKFADNLKRELPRIPLAPDFRAFSKAGKSLAALHLDYEKLDPWKLKWIETPGAPLSYRVQKMKLSKDKTTLTVNESLTLAGIPPEVSDYRMGNRSGLEWVIDQYQVSTDKRSGIKSDPNREDDPEYIVRLVGQVVRVSVETVKIVKLLPVEFAPAVTRK